MQDPATRVNMLEIGSLVGEYRIEKLVGQGGMGQVYGAVHPVIGKRAAIKVLRGELCADPETIERFVLEARAVNQIGHPNIVDVFAFGALPDGRQYMVMEWLRGESLDQRIRRMLPSLAETCEIALAICAALEAAHAEQIVHRDLKPHNVFMAYARGLRPQVKLLDFGLVKLIGEQHVERTRSGSMLGTPAYMSPEQARGRGVDHRTDLYALGVMLFELVTGTLPFLEASAMEMVMAHLQRPPPVPSSYRGGIPPALDRLIVGLLDKEPGNRPTLAEVAAVLTSVQHLVASTPQATTPTVVAGGSAPAHELATLVPAHSTPVPMMAPTLPSVVAPSIANGSAPAGPPLAHASVAPVIAPVAPVEPAAPAGKRRALLAILAALAVGGLAFGVVMAVRSSDAQVAVPASPPPVDAAPVGAIDAAAHVEPAVAPSPPADAALVAPADAATSVRLDARTVKPSRDAGASHVPDAPLAPPPAPDAGAVSPVDDGDGLMKTGGSR